MSEHDIVAERLRRLSEVTRDRSHANVRPKDAATLILLDRAAGGPWRMLMGRRHMRHRFMPGAYVFPGGGVETGDRRADVAADFRPETLARLSRGLRSGQGAARAKALAVAALRETYEETGVVVGSRVDGNAGRAVLPGYADHAALPDLSRLAFLAQAITPPGRPKRFNARFFAAFAADVIQAPEAGAGPSGELEDIAWLSVADTRALPLPSITVTMIDELMERLATDPRLDDDRAVPYYFWRGASYRRNLI